ncbi:lipid-transfer protein [Streptomyces orinoci]|uniref:Lipid-transfer protein n=1 Tax=Streptomyces orinoci TaxID=67339 RepID=A0ABV3JV34_STRON|nr:lipid-transfer protein [Streptomyces orinoci]
MEPPQVAVVAYARSAPEEDTAGLSEAELLLPVLGEVLQQAGLRPGEPEFTCSGSSDYLAGRPFSFTLALDAVGAWPPIAESHVETDGAWALYEAWVKLLTGEARTALVYAHGKASAGEPERVLSRQLDPYCLAPLWPGPEALAGLQERALIDAGELAEPAPGKGPPAGDGAAAVVLAAGETARRICGRPAWIHGIDHRVEPQALGVRDLTDSPSTRLAAERAGAYRASVDVAELHTPHPAQEVVLRKALALGADAEVHASGADPLMVAGLIRLGEAAARIHRGEAGRVLAHATSGPCLQQNLVAVLEGERG